MKKYYVQTNVNMQAKNNAALKTKETLLRNLRYSRNWLSSKLFSGLNIPYRKIDELIAANPDADYYAIYLKLIGR